MPSGLQSLMSGGENIRRQLQTNDPTSPANALGTLVKWYTDWRAQQAAEPDITNPPMGFSAPAGGLQSLMGMLRDAAGKPMRMYHGTPKVFDKFDPRKADQDALYGPGHYFTNSPEVASGYAGRSATDAPNIRPAFLDIKKPFDLDAAMDPRVREAWGGSYTDLPPRPWRPEPVGQRTNEELYNDMTKSMDKPEIAALLRQLGFDGITHTGGARTGTPPHQVGIAFDPKQILPPWRIPE